MNKFWLLILTITLITASCNNNQGTNDPSKDTPHVFFITQHHSQPYTTITKIWRDGKDEIIDYSDGSNSWFINSFFVDESGEYFMGFKDGNACYWHNGNKKVLPTESGGQFIQVINGHIIACVGSDTNHVVYIDDKEVLIEGNLWINSIDYYQDTLILGGSCIKEWEIQLALYKIITPFTTPKVETVDISNFTQKSNISKVRYSSTGSLHLLLLKYDSAESEYYIDGIKQELTNYTITDFEVVGEDVYYLATQKNLEYKQSKFLIHNNDVIEFKYPTNYCDIGQIRIFDSNVYAIGWVSNNKDFSTYKIAYWTSTEKCVVIEPNYSNNETPECFINQLFVIPQ